MNKKRVNIILGIIVIILILILCLCIKNIINTLKSNNQVVVLEFIENYNYNLNENDPKLFKEKFSKLKNVLNEENVDEEEYAKLISQLFIIDFLTLDSSLNKNDVGGVQFIHESFQENFIKKAKDTIYNSVENNMYGKRKQKLPIVKNVTIDNIEKYDIDYEEYKDENGYILNLNIEYESDLKYPKEATIIVGHFNGKLEIVSIETR